MTEGQISASVAAMLIMVTSRWQLAKAPDQPGRLRELVHQNIPSAKIETREQPTSRPVRLFTLPMELHT